MIDDIGDEFSKLSAAGQLGWKWVESDGHESLEKSGSISAHARSFLGVIPGLTKIRRLWNF